MEHRAWLGVDRQGGWVDRASWQTCAEAEGRGPAEELRRGLGLGWAPRVVSLG